MQLDFKFINFFPETFHRTNNCHVVLNMQGVMINTFIPKISSGFYLGVFNNLFSLFLPKFRENKFSILYIACMLVTNKLHPQ
jgi:hypothetical protein